MALGKISEDATVIPRATLIHDCQVCCGIVAQVAVESVSKLPWNRGPGWRGISGRFAAEYAPFSRAA